jgi:hypothetical protein
MDFLLVVLMLLPGAWVLKSVEQRRRIVLLATHLRGYQVERHLEALTQGYVRALGEQDAQRRAAAWESLHATEQALCAQFARFAADFARADAAITRVSTLPIWVPFALTLLPQASFDMRAALALHARGICNAVEADSVSQPRERAFAILAELFLMQHTCHWFCKSRLVASARMLSRHKTSYEQALAAVLPRTRADYAELVGR